MLWLYLIEKYIMIMHSVIFCLYH